MHRVEPLGLRFGEARHAQRENPETGLLNGGENLARVPVATASGLMMANVRSKLIDGSALSLLFRPAWSRP